MGGSRRRRLQATAAAGTAAVAAGLVVVPARPADAATLTVTDPGDAGPNTLRGKVAAANPGDVIEFDPSITAITLLTGAITIDKSLTISGPSSRALTIDGGSTDRIFYAYDGPANTPHDVTISHLTLTHGSAATGGAVLAKGENLTLDDATVVDNVATTGNGGGVAVLGNDGATLTVDGSTITSNSAGAYGGGISLDSVTGLVTISDSTISSNTSGVGIGRLGQGGGIWSKRFGPQETLRIERSSVTGNTADPDVANSGESGGGIYTKYVDVALVDSTISGNSAEQGAGLFVNQRSLTATGTTIADNQGVSGGGVDLSGNADATFESTTIAGNSASSIGGGVYVPNRTVTMRDTVIADNAAPTKPDLGAMTVHATYSLVEVDESSIAGHDGNLTGDPVLGPLADNGGRTATKLPGLASPLIDAGDPAYAAPPSTDQRGEPRVRGNAIDIGSVERAPAAPVQQGPAPPQPVSVSVPPRGEGESTTVAVKTDAGTVTVELSGADPDGATISVRLVEGTPTTGYAVLGRVYDVHVEGSSGGGTLCLPYDPAAGAGHTPVMLHFLPDGTSQLLPATVEDGRLCAVVTSFSPFVVALLDTTRLAGVDAVATAAAISASAFQPGVPTAYVVARSRVDDAVAAGAAGGPVLLVDRDTVPDATAAELTRLAPGRIVVVGGTAAVSDAVVARLRATRVAGRDRFETAAALALDARRPGVPVAYVVNGASIADGLVASAAASHDGGVVLPVTRDAVPASIGKAIASLRPARVVVVGGTAAVSDAVARSLGAARIAGADRYATSAAVAQAVGDGDLAVARGDDPTDALAGAPLGRPLVLVARDALPSQVQLVLGALKPTSITILGGTDAVSATTEIAAAASLRKP